MELRDWLIVIIPVILNGSVVFLLQKRFEKRQFSREIKREHTRILLEKVNNSIDLLIQLKSSFNNSNNPFTEEGKLSEDILSHYVNFHESNIKVYNYLSSNDNAFNYLKKDTETIKETGNEMAKGGILTVEKVSEIFDKILAALKNIKKKCENQNI